jgi:hypothetical protein
VLRIDQDAVHRADLDALGFLEVADALGAQARFDEVDFVTLGDGAVRALGFADIAVDTFVGDVKGHDTSLYGLFPVVSGGTG